MPMFSIQGVPSWSPAGSHPCVIPSSSTPGSRTISNHQYPDPVTGPSTTPNTVPFGRSGSYLIESSVTVGFDRTRSVVTMVRARTPTSRATGGLRCADVATGSAGGDVGADDAALAGTFRDGWIVDSYVGDPEGAGFWALGDAY